MEKRSLLVMSSAILMLLFSIFMLTQTKMVQGAWQRLDLAGGGVPEDLEKVRIRRSTTDSTDAVWATGMGSGLFRSEWNGSSYGTWHEYLTGKGIFGVDVISGDSAGATWEYVLAGAAGQGVIYARSSTGTFPNIWNRPNNGQNQYPHSSNNDWRLVTAHDVAFYCKPDSTYPINPDSQYFVIMYDPDSTVGINNDGIYKWNYTSHIFDRIGNPIGDSSRAYSHFYRDMSDPNVLYVLGGSATPNGNNNLWRISGAYNNLSFTRMDIAKMVQSSDSTKEVCSFNQWKYKADSTYTYVLLHYYDNGTPKYGAFYYLNLANATGNSPANGCGLILDDLDGGGTGNSLIADEDVKSMLVGKPHFVAGIDSAYHYLWITCPIKGALYYDSHSASSLTQIVNSTSVTTTPKPYRWGPRSMIPDFQDHITGSEKMRLFLGTHHGGPFLLIW
jgi:hypothetical protein